jgi:hypothetical protein
MGGRSGLIEFSEENSTCAWVIDYSFEVIEVLGQCGIDSPKLLAEFEESTLSVSSSRQLVKNLRASATLAGGSSLRFARAASQFVKAERIVNKLAGLLWRTPVNTSGELGHGRFEREELFAVLCVRFIDFRFVKVHPLCFYIG